jgi:DNA-binding MarR family transcriptional regulator
MALVDDTAVPRCPAGPPKQDGAATLASWNVVSPVARNRRRHRTDLRCSRELADQMLLQHHGAVQLVDRLCKAGLARRIHSAKDRRSVLVVLTA